MAPDPVEHYAAEADATRERIASTIDEIQERLDPRRMLNEAVGKMSNGSSQLAGQARDTLKAHPLAVGAGIAAMGLALLARNRLANARVDLGEISGDYTDYDDGFGFGEAPAQRFGAGEYDDTPGAADRARMLAARAEDGVASSPFVSILLGLAAGAALGAFFPATETERRAFGETSQKLGAAARAAARRAADELDAAGLSVDAVKTRAGDAMGKARAAVRSVADAARDELKG